MANPKKKNGRTPVENDFLEAVVRQFPGSVNEWRILMVIVRKTWGWHKVQDQISLSQFALATGMRKPHICRALNKLRERGFITQSGNGRSVSYRIGADFDKWKPLPKQVKREIVTGLGNKSLPDQGPTKENIQKKKDCGPSVHPDLFLKTPNDQTDEQETHSPGRLPETEVDRAAPPPSGPGNGDARPGGRGPVKSEVPAFFDLFAEMYFKKYRAKYTPVFGKDQKILKDLLALHGPEKLKKYFERHFRLEPKDNMIIKNSGHTIGTLFKVINKLAEISPNATDAYGKSL